MRDEISALKGTVYIRKRHSTVEAARQISVVTDENKHGHVFSAFLQEKKLIGCMYGSTRFREHMPKLIDLFLQDKLDLTSLVSRRLKLEDVNEAFRSMKAGEVARSVLEFS